jgi:hypothetical protein
MPAIAIDRRIVTGQISNQVVFIFGRSSPSRPAAAVSPKRKPIRGSFSYDSAPLEGPAVPIREAAVNFAETPEYRFEVGEGQRNPDGLGDDLKQR